MRVVCRIDLSQYNVGELRQLVRMGVLTVSNLERELEERGFPDYLIPKYKEECMRRLDDVISFVLVVVVTAILSVFAWEVVTGGVSADTILSAMP